jgi:hypothetical protein
VTACSGALRALYIYDVAEEIRLSDIKANTPEPRRGFTLPSPEYVRYEQPPVSEHAGTVRVDGESFEARISYFDRGVVSLQLSRSFSCTWEEMSALTNRWIGAPELERQALQEVIARLAKIEHALEKPYQLLLGEDYIFIELNEAVEDGVPLQANDLLTRHGHAIACMLRGEPQALSEAEVKEVLSSSMSYNPNDLLVASWMASLVFDTPQGAAATIDLLEYANAQLLEYRRYDQLLTRVLEEGYDALEVSTPVTSYWRLAQQARQLNALRLDVMELTERTDNAIKFLSDMYYARVHQLASARVGVNDYRRLVDEKLKTAGELYEFMVSEFREARMFLLEVTIVVILVIDLLFLFTGKH